ncbi:hypothetical protein K505DRAFT_92228 [Melanomma pulvis-pyrius CBS 109.77]|uniref:Uncharacterized protein n=1 Tax=Melanomma pulvis-pyrius CBS 109.77 TaxID=1314802 RepID=A0A6A6XQY5_9PLEO|nr:hypothetical protein K505DRAFT_92228 [Melanomma pulvis-pyrius CBS 109.77]
MYHQNPFSGPREPWSPSVFDDNGHQHFNNLIPMYPDQQDPLFYDVQSQAATHHVEPHAHHQFGPIPPNTYDLPSCYQDVMIRQHHQQVPLQPEVPNTVHSEPRESSMSYLEAMDLVQKFNPEALRVIQIQHLISTKPVITNLRDENSFLKRLLQSCHAAVPNLVGSHVFENLYAEQPDGYPLPVSRYFKYGLPYTPTSSVSSDSSNPITPIPVTSSTPPSPYDSRDENTPPRVPLYTEPAAMGPATMQNGPNSGMPGPFDVAIEGIDGMWRRTI